MWKKRTSSVFGIDEQKIEGSGSAFQQDDNTKRAKLTSLSDTTLQDLPIELIECILIKVVVMEVKGMKLAKSVWKEKADLVISRLRTVCSQWSSILTTNFFRKEINRILDGTAHETFRLEILHQSPIQFYVSSITTMKDEIFMLCELHHRGHFINVYDRNNMTKEKDVIPLRGFCPQSIAACSVSNCVYVLERTTYYCYFSIWRFARDNKHRFIASIVINEIYLPHPIRIRVTANGSLILSRLRYNQLPAISVCGENDSMPHEMRLSPDISSFRNIIPKSNGNLVLVSGSPTKLLEIDMDGIIIRQYQSSLDVFKFISHADNFGRILIADDANRMELLDSEFNLMDFTGPHLSGGQFIFPFELHYNRERNEMVAIISHRNFPNGALTIFQLKEI